MKLVILKNNLKSGLNAVSKAIGSNSNLPIISNVLIKTHEGKVRLIGTNLEIGIICTISGKVVEEGGISVPYDVISGIINNISSERINLEVKNNNLIITTDNYEASIQGINESEFPIIPKVKKENSFIEINHEALKEALNKIVFAAGSSDLRPEINGVFISVENNFIKLVSTDSFRLAEVKISEGQFKNNLSEIIRAIIPLKTAEILSKLTTDDLESEKIRLFFDENQLLVKTEGFEMISRLVEGKFPDYEPIIPKEFSTEVILSREELTNALKLAGSFALKVKDVRVRVKDGKIFEVYSSDNSLGENKYLIPAKITGGDIEGVFNLRYLLDGVKAENSSEIYIGLNENTRPSIIKNPKTQTYFYILMPVKG